MLFDLFQRSLNRSNTRKLSISRIFSSQDEKSKRNKREREDIHLIFVFFFHKIHRREKEEDRSLD